MRSMSEAETEAIAQSLAGQLRGGEIIELVGDIGAGKTTFVRGLARGLGSADHVSSPTFTVCNIYQGNLSIYHCDFYRLGDDALIKQELEDMMAPDHLVVLEWASELSIALPESSVRVYITPDGEQVRDIRIVNVQELSA